VGLRDAAEPDLPPASPAWAEEQAAGLTSVAAEERLASDGPNIVPEAARRGVLRQILGQLTHLLAVLLWVAAAFALLAGMPQLAVAIVIIVLLNAAFAFWQEYRADRSTRQLRQLLPSLARVVRNGEPTTIDTAALVRGDLVLLAAGDRVAADMTVVDADGLSVDESMVTGESRPVPHAPSEPLLAGTFISQGEGTAVVVATGTRTTLAGISALGESAERPPSPLSRQLARVVRVVAVVAVTVGVLLGVSGVALGLTPTEAFLFAVGVAVALVPEGLLPTVTLSLARGARLMAGEHALVRRLDAVETLGATTFICTDKTGTLTQNRMAVVEVVTERGTVRVRGHGYDPDRQLDGDPQARALVPGIVETAAVCVTGRVVRREAEWVADGDPMEAAIAALAASCGVAPGDRRLAKRRPFSPDRMLSSAVAEGEISVLGAPEQVFARCRHISRSARDELARLSSQGRRMVAVARRSWCSGDDEESTETDLELLGLLGIQDPPRTDIGEALAACRHADIRVAMLTGDHPRTAEAIGREIGLLDDGGLTVTGPELPADDGELGLLLDRPGGVVVARVTPADKFRIARALRDRGHVVAMTGDGVNDAPALREADVGVAMGASGSDVAREAADLVLLDDNFGTIVSAVELGRATFRNVRRFLTYHLTDNVAELTPFAAWALTGGNFPLAIGVLQVLALDIGTDMLPALALGAESPSPRVMEGRHERAVLDRPLLTRAFGILGAVEAVASMAGFALVLRGGGWHWGEEPSAELLAVASGTAFAIISCCQMANAFACRSEALPFWRLRVFGNRFVLAAVAAEMLLLLGFLGAPSLSRILGGSWPDPRGWAFAAAGVVLLLAVDGAAKSIQAVRRET
jgi:magnesium-transporting ATPase (P-type)